MNPKAVTPGLPAADAQTDPLAELGPAFKAAAAAVRRLRGRERRHPEDLRDAQYGLLFGLCEGQPLSLGELAQRADLSAAAATELLDELAEAEYVHRSRSEQDRRVVLVSLTGRGRALVQARRAEHEPRWRSAFSGFTDAELATAVSVLWRMREFFEELAEER